MNYDDSDDGISRIEIDDNGDEVGGIEISLKAREPKTQLQKKFIAGFPGMKRFPSSGAHKRFRKFEDLTLSGDEDAIKHRGFFKSVMSWVAKKNTHQIIIRCETVIGMLLDTDRYLEYTGTGECAEFVLANKTSVAMGKAAPRVNILGAKREDGDNG